MKANHCHFIKMNRGEHYSNPILNDIKHDNNHDVNTLEHCYDVDYPENAYD